MFNEIWDNFSEVSVATEPLFLNKTNCLGRGNKLTDYSLEAIVVLIILTSLFCLFAFAGNVTVIIAITRDRIISKHKQHLYLLSLAVADALLVVLVVPFSLTNELLGYWPFGDIYCRIYLSLDILFCTASICNICCIGIDRYVSVKYPTKYKKLRRLPRIRGAILFIWIYASVVSLFPFTTETTIIQGAKHECFLIDSPWFIILSSSLSFFIPTCIIAPVYLKIFMIGRRLAAAQKARSLLRKTTLWNGNAGSNNAKQCLGNGVNADASNESFKQKLLRVNLADSCSSCSAYIDRPSTSSVHPFNILVNVETGQITPVVADEGTKKESETKESIAHWRYGNFLDIPNAKRCQSCSLFPCQNPQERPKDSLSEKQADKETAFLRNYTPFLDNENKASGCPTPRLQVYARNTPCSSSTTHIRHQNRNRLFDSLRTCCNKASSSREYARNRMHFTLAPPNDNFPNCNPTQKETSPDALSSTKGKNSALKRRASTISALRILGASRREKRFIFIISVVTGFFLLCWTPFFTTYFVYAIFGGNCCIDQNMFKIFFWIGYLNSGINPILYTVFNKDFRQAFKRLFSSSRPNYR